MLAGNASAMYGFDLNALVPRAREIGPTIEDLAGPMDVSEIPPDAWTEALETELRPAGT